MKKFLLPVFWMVCFSGFAQKQDYKWLFGYDNVYAATDTNFGGVIVDFDSTPPLVTKHIRLADMDECNVSYCDANGELLYYSNGGDIFDRRDSIMLNGDSLDYGYEWKHTEGIPGNRYAGLRETQGLLALPMPSDSSKSLLTGFDIRYFDLVYPSYLVDSSYYSVIDLNGNSGYGQVIIKNKLLLADTLTFGTFSAVRHGNGQDWWLIHSRYYGDCYYKFLLTGSGLAVHDTQCIGLPQLNYGDLGSSCFTPDGSKYFWVNSSDNIHMFDFDRCTGLLSNPEIIPFPYPSFVDSVPLTAGIAVSPGGRYLYVIGASIALQYDLQATNIGASVDTVAVYDKTYDPEPPFVADFFLAQLGPDGKIYINSTSGVKHLGVINNPDGHGDSCNLTQHSFYLHTFNESSMPNFPNYRLGALNGSPCDTLSTLTEIARAEKEKILKVYPNPSTDYIVIDYGFTDWNKGEVSLQICDEVGQTVFTQPLPMYSGYQKINVANYQSGIYTAYIIRSNAIVAAQKFVKQ